MTSRQYSKGGCKNAETTKPCRTNARGTTPDAPLDDEPTTAASNESQASDKRPARASGFYAATRAGKKKVTASLDPAAHKQLRQLGLDRDMTTERC